MKVLVQSDDYGFTRGVVAGMCDAFARGIITSTGLFANMPIAEYAVEQVKKYPHICLGIDINVSSGPSVADPKLLPTEDRAVHPDLRAAEGPPLAGECGSVQAL